MRLDRARPIRLSRRSVVAAVRRVAIVLASVVACVAALVASSTATAAPQVVRAGPLKVLSTRPAAIEGAPLVLPVRFGEPPPEGREVAPVRVEFRDRAGKSLARVDATVAWPVLPSEGEVEPNRWATASNALRLVARRPAKATDAYLLLEPPPGTPADATLLVAGQRVEPAFYPAADPAALARIAERASTIAARMPREPRLSLPDPKAPFERFRFAIGGLVRGWPDPEPLAPASPDDLAARATTALWLAALARIAGASEATAAELAEALVATADDGDARLQVAAWIADPAEISSILALALDRSRAPAAVADALATFLRQRSPIVVWVDDDGLNWVGVAIANPLPEEAIVRLRWLGGDDPPIATIVPAASIIRARVARRVPAPSDDAPVPRAPAETLVVEHRDQSRRVVGPPSVLGAGVSGPAFGTFLRPLDLVGIATGGAQSAPPQYQTRASLRPRLDGWEVFVEASFPRDADLAARGRVTVVGPGGEAVTIAIDYIQIIVM
ncbi:MAG: hypothetical protein ACKO0W_08140 [Planctomycetota bacterium]